MGLPWFAFDIKAWQANTRRLSTEAKGAYLAILLDYYEHGEGPPDDDEILATITELPLEVWKKHRRVIAPMFEIEGGIWHHTRVRNELRNGQRRYDRTVAASEAAKAAREAKAAAKKADKAQYDTDQNVTESVTDTVTVNVTTTQEQEQEQRQEREEFPKGGNSSLSSPPEFSKVDQGLGEPLPSDFQPSGQAIALAHAHGLTNADIKTELRKFMAKNIDAQCADWDAAFTRWIEREIAWRDRPRNAKAPPRIELSVAKVSRDYQPTEAEYDRQCTLFAKNGRWSHQLGPEPGQLGCRCPPEILRKHGINPETGLKLEQAS